MMRNYALFLIALLGICLTSCSSPKQRYLIGMPAFNKSSQFSLKTYLDAIELPLQRSGGELIVMPIRSSGAMDNSTLPEQTFDLPGDFILIWKFQNTAAISSYLASSEFMKLQQEMDSQADSNVLFTARQTKPMPGMPAYPMLSNDNLRYENGFMMINAITMKNPVLAPTTLFRMMRYVKKNTPELEKRGTNFFAAIKKEKIISGNFDFDMLFLTEWKTEQIWSVRTR